MEINTKFEVGQQVYFLRRNKVESATIQKINVFIENVIEGIYQSMRKEIDLYYNLNGIVDGNGDLKRFYETDLHISREELANSIIKGTYDK